VANARTKRPQPATRRALIVEGGGALHALAAARALGAAGWEVGLAVSGEPGGRSRHVRRVHRVPAPERAPEAFLDGVALAVRAWSYDVVFGADDIEVLALSAGRDRIPCVVPHAAHEQVLRAVDKLELARAAQRAGLAAPETRPADDQGLAALDGPAVVKARLHCEPGEAPARRHVEAVLCEDPRSAARHARTMTAAGARPLLQAPVGGDLMALTVVIDHNGMPVGLAQQRSTRLSLRRTSTRAQTVPLEPHLAVAATRLLRDLRWFGLANLQFLRPPGGEPQLIDFNGRFYGSLALAVAAGVNLPDLWGRLALGEPVRGRVIARPGVRFQSLVEDVRRARVERRGGLVRDLAQTLAYAPQAVHPAASSHDPMPAVALAGRLAGAGAARLAPTRRAPGPAARPTRHARA
jgi:predicted ATP-grasp superfamily ATP-dependent carboligase